MTTTNDVTVYVEEDVGFYPTPSDLAEKMLSAVDWPRTVSILEPSAGKGNIIDELLKQAYEERQGRYGRTNVVIDAVEIDSDLRGILEYKYGGGALRDINKRLAPLEQMSYSHMTEEQKSEYDSLRDEKYILNSTEVHIVSDDFLTYTTFKQYDVIVMNPPFDNGDEHLLHALELQKNGGTVICLLNAETIRNPYTKRRTLLKQKLEKYGAEIEYIKNAFVSAERKTGVEIALITVKIPEKDFGSFIYDGLKKAKKYDTENFDATAMTPSEFFTAIVNQFNFEVDATIRLIREYLAFKPYMQCSFDKEYGASGAILTLSLSKDGRNYDQTVNINEYLKIVRLKYWRALFRNKEFSGALTENLYSKYLEIIEKMDSYDFTLYNIKLFQAKMMSEMTRGVDETIVELFDKLSSTHSWYPECSGNIHYFNGWATNKAHMINTKKVIIPTYGAYSSYSWERNKLNESTAYKVLSDIEKVLNYLDTEGTEGPDLWGMIRSYNDMGITKKIPCKYFYATFYKKGTCHIEWRDPRIPEKLNIYGCRRKGWLPPCYGKKKYSDLTEEEKTVIDEFQGEEEYEKVVKHADFYLAEVSSVSPLMLAGGTE